MPNIWIFPLERLDSRYTDQWYENIPKMLVAKAGDKFNIRQIDGVQRESSTTSGAFLNFSDTNYWKSSQLCNFIDVFNRGETTPKDKFLFTDVWNPTILQVKYINDLLGFDWELHSIAHAGAYDPTDILGLKMQKPWPWHAERAFFHACDYTYFATYFHREMFLNNLNIPDEFSHKAVRSGQPHDLIVPVVEQYLGAAKAPSIVWPHRYNDDKQPDIAEAISMHFPVVFTQKKNLSKPEYYRTLSQNQILFSCSLHENLGISVMEAVLMNTIPLLPDRCSYAEMYDPVFLYPSEYTESFEMFEKHRIDLYKKIEHMLTHPEFYAEHLKRQQQRLKDEYLTADIMINYLVEGA